VTVESVAAAGTALLLLLAGCTVEPAPTTPTAAPTTGATGRRCPPTGLSTGPITSQVVVVTTAPMSAAAGSVLRVTTEIVVLSDGPSVVARPQWSSLEVLGRGAVVARAVGTAGADVPTPITRGTTVPARTVPTQITLTGCDGTPLPPGAYRLRALVGYALDGPGSPTGGYVIASESVDLAIT
jgi:hypothetical protein